MIGLGNVFRALQNTRNKQRLDASFSAPPHRVARLVGRLVSAEARPSGAHLRYESAELSAQFLTPEMVFMAWDGATMQPSYAVAQADWSAVETSLMPIEKGWRLRSSALEIQFAADGTLRYLTPAGKPFRLEEPLQRFERGWLQQAQLSSTTCIYGLGERSARLNLRGGSYRFWNLDAGGNYGPGADPLYIGMPVYYSLDEDAGCLVFYDNTFDGRISLHERAEIRFEGGPARCYLIVGEPAAALAQFTALVGRAALPPRWALGYQQSQWGYRTEAEMRRVWAGFQQHNLPLSVLVLDCDHMRGYRTLTPDEARYPTLAEFSRELAGQDVHLVASTNPGIKVDKGFDLYNEGLKEDVYSRLPDGSIFRGVVWPGWASFPDFSQQRVREWWGAQYARALKHGIDGFWHDMNEPASFTAWGEMTFPLCVQHDQDGRGGDHREVHNVFGLLMNRAGYEGLRKLRPERRPFILSRSGWVGMQRHAWCWTGDIQSSWAVLRQTVACVLGLGLSGMPYAGPDIGGFSGAPGAELYLRWFQLSSCLPFFRTHCIFFLPRREPWEFGPQVLDAARAQLQFRYRMMPYLYTLAWQASQDGSPLVRPLFWAAPAQRELWEVDDAFLLGGDVLVAPVVEEGARQRPIHLPPGGWYEWESQRLHRGPGWIQVDAPLERLPLLVRAGSILPTTEDGALVLHAYRPLPGEAGSGTLYSDAGDGFGAWRAERFGLAPDGAGYTFTWESEGLFDWPYSAARLRLHGFEGARVTIGPVPIPVELVENS